MFAPYWTNGHPNTVAVQLLGFAMTAILYFLLGGIAASEQPSAAVFIVIYGLTLFVRARARYLFCFAALRRVSAVHKLRR